MLKRFHAIGYFSAFVLPALVVFGYFSGGWYNFSCVIFVFIIVPIFDQWNGTDPRIMDRTEENAANNQRVYRLILFIWVIFHLLFLAWSFSVFPSLAKIHEILGFVLGVGLVTGAIGITIAHELGHKKSKTERLGSKVLLMTVFYMHFYVEHNRGHHVSVGTKEDPATAAKDENFYQFWVKSVFKGYLHAWKLEKQRLNKLGKGVISVQNQMLAFALLPCIYCFSQMGLIYLILGTWYWTLLLFFLAQSIIAFTLLELVNYVEHYGLKRKIDENGRPEPVSDFHSWNSSHVISNYFLFQLQLHSDHHMHAIKRYQTLQHCEDSPQLPAGYPTMILAALVPLIWFRLVHPVLQSWENK